MVGQHFCQQKDYHKKCFEMDKDVEKENSKKYAANVDGFCEAEARTDLSDRQAV